MTPVEETVLELLGGQGSLGAAEVVDLALYGDRGFYGNGGMAGRRGDFLTSPEVGPLFGAVVAGALDRWWRLLGEPDPFTVIEGGAGAGTLARTVIAPAPACASALHWVCVERSASLREAAAATFPFTELASPVTVGTAGSGPTATIVGDLPAGRLTGIVLANELLDNLPPVIAELTGDGWVEVRVREEHGRLVEVLVPSAEVARAAQRWAGAAPVGSRIPLANQARAWVERARSCLDAGWVVCFDYGATTAELADRGFDGWLRTYRGHGRGGHWLEDLGHQDITYDVPIDQLGPASVETQAAWLRRFGIDGLTAHARYTWHQRAAIGDLAALRARGRVAEAAALTDESGLGAFLVLTWPAGATRTSHAPG